MGWSSYEGAAMTDASQLREQARRIWQAAVAAVDPYTLVRDFLTHPPAQLAEAERILVVGGGKAGSAMAAGVEGALADKLERITGGQCARPSPPTPLPQGERGEQGEPLPDGNEGDEGHSSARRPAGWHEPTDRRGSC